MSISMSHSSMVLTADYDYSFEDLKPWSEQLVPKVAEKARSGAIFYNNYVRSQAPRNARLYSEQLASQGYE